MNHVVRIEVDAVSGFETIIQGFEGHEGPAGVGDPFDCDIVIQGNRLGPVGDGLGIDIDSVAAGTEGIREFMGVPLGAAYPRGEHFREKTDLHADPTGFVGRDGDNWRGRTRIHWC